MTKRLKILISVFVVLAILTVGVFLAGPRLFASVAFPLPEEYKPLIKNSSEEFGVNPNFLCALIFTESGFKPTAKSYVGATGLTQVMPATGRAIASRLGVDNFQVSDLNKPEVSIRFGAYYIADAIKRNGGNKTLGLIAYNGGQGAVIAYNLGIPVRGTVAYAQKIISLEQVYQSTYGNWAGSVTGSSVITPASSAVGPDVSPKTNPDVVNKISIVDFWKLMISGRNNQQ